MSFGDYDSYIESTFGSDCLLIRDGATIGKCKVTVTKIGTQGEVKAA